MAYELWRKGNVDEPKTNCEESTSTIDAALVRAAELSKTTDSNACAPYGVVDPQSVVVFDRNQRVRTSRGVAIAGKWLWAVICKTCSATGKNPTPPANASKSPWGGAWWSPDACAACKGAGWRPKGHP